MNRAQVWAQTIGRPLLFLRRRGIAFRRAHARTRVDYVLTQKFCIGSTDGSPGNNKDVFSNKCYKTKYTVEYLSNQY
jgi:hypothetical protein